MVATAPAMRIDKAMAAMMYCARLAGSVVSMVSLSLLLVCLVIAVVGRAENRPGVAGRHALQCLAMPRVYGHKDGVRAMWLVGVGLLAVLAGVFSGHCALLGGVYLYTLSLYHTLSRVDAQTRQKLVGKLVLSIGIV